MRLKDRVVAALKDKGVALQQELLFINDDLEVVSKQQVSHEILKGALKELETEGVIETYDQKIGRRVLKMVKYTGEANGISNW